VRLRIPGPQPHPSDAWRLVENRAALLRVGHHRTVASVPDPAAPRAQRLRGGTEAWNYAANLRDRTLERHFTPGKQRCLIG